MKYTFLFIFILSFLSIKAQTTSLLLGRVLDEKTNTPIENVNVKITYSPWNISKTTISDKKGIFSVSNLSPGGPYIVKFSCSEYEDQIRELSSLDLGSNNLSLHMRKTKIDELANVDKQILEFRTKESILLLEMIKIVKNDCMK